MAMMPFSEAKRTMLSKLRGSRKTLLPVPRGGEDCRQRQDGDQPEDALEAEHQIEEASRLLRGCRALLCYHLCLVHGPAPSGRRALARRRRFHDPFLGGFAAGEIRGQPALAEHQDAIAHRQQLRQL